MNKQFFTLLIAFVSLTAFSQRTIENPEYGMSTYSGEITKIELLDDATVLHFNIKLPVGRKFSIPSRSRIVNPITEEEFKVIKGGVAVEVEGSYVIPESGEMDYSLVFPKIDPNLTHIDFRENEIGGSWNVYDIVLNERDTSKLPKALKGNWLKTDGSNTWVYGLHSKNAIVDKTIWKYKSVLQKRKHHIITLENNKEEKVIYAKINANNTVSFGTDKKQLKPYSLEKTNNPNFKLENDTPYTPETIFKKDSATYSGYIKGYNRRVGKKTGMVYVDNILTGDQDSYVIEVAENGSFSVKFPLYHPQSVYVRLAGFRDAIFTEPSKETWQFISNTPSASLFMGDCAQVNTDLQMLNKVRIPIYNDIQKKILKLSPKQYTKYCDSVYELELNKFYELNKTNTFSKKGLQVAKLNMEYGNKVNLLSYRMHINAFKRQNPDTEIENKTLTAGYYNFVTSEVLNNELAVLTPRYNSFINYLKFEDVFRNSNITQPSINDLANHIQNNGAVLTKEELEMIEASKQAQTPQILQKQVRFLENFGEVQMDFFRKYSAVYHKLTDEEKHSTDMFTYFLNKVKEEGNTITEKEEQFFKAQKTLYTQEEKKVINSFSKAYASKIADFNKNHKNLIRDFHMKKFSDNRKQKMQEIFKVEKSFVFDVMYSQDVSRGISAEVTPISDIKLTMVKKEMETPFISKYVEDLNVLTKAKIEANKTKTDFVVNDTPKTEADKVFDAIISKYKGKVVFVDFWATWCGPCRSGMKKMKPMKEELKDKDVVFVYITNPSSPETTYKNMIPEIKGEHYRVSDDEWNYLSSKFNITGIPHYMLVNKEGKVVKDKIYFASSDNNAFKKLIEEQL